MPRRLQEPSSTFGRRLQQARQAIGLSQRDLGIRAELDPFVASTRINRYERGIHEPDAATAKKLAKVLDVPLAYFYADNERLARMIKMFSGLSVAEQEKLLKNIESRGETS